ncbi:MAG: YchJ family protein [Flavobacteriales bacterium]|nr:YchJ family protein [Flavobacteriales bacterium]
MNAEDRCPCQSGNIYLNCCSPYHKGLPAPSAEKLMRSRYSAYALRNVQYLVDTTHSSTRKDHPYEAIEKWAEQTTWKRLEIVRTEKGTLEDSSGIVEFKATYNDGSSSDEILHESSHFLKENARWYYVDGKHSRIAIPRHRIGRNDPCTCGSGKKFKKCCG